MAMDSATITGSSSSSSPGPASSLSAVTSATSSTFTSSSPISTSSSVVASPTSTSATSSLVTSTVSPSTSSLTASTQTNSVQSTSTQGTATQSTSTQGTVTQSTATQSTLTFNSGSSAITSTPTISSVNTATSSGTASVTSVSTSSFKSSTSSSSASPTPSITYVTTTQQYTGYVTTTTTVPPSGTVSGTVIVQTPLPTLTCDANGYLIQRNTAVSPNVQSLYRVNIATGTQTLIKQSVGSGATSIDAMGYNVFDGYLYGTIGTTPGSLLRIGGNGDSQTLASLGLTTAVNAGDVDEAGYYWASASGKQWWQFDYSLLDWAYTPNPNLAAAEAGCCLYGLGYDAGALGAKLLLLNTYMLQFNRTTKAWAMLRNFGNLGGQIIGGKAEWGAVYAASDGFLYGSENNSGDIWQFPLTATGGAPVRKSTGTASKQNQNDGARCIKGGAM
ncbi:hypothetical protein PG994_000579 [Apiospora phragmitis]|uniref:DUF6923 domain-containing protein n=1 Tax=Apiospora phragmitis TaxID=2905665 RepID=A0ABR1X6N4_9PEZI